VREGNHDAIDAIYGPPLSMISKCLRSFFVAPPGRKLIAGDWSNVESRGAAWFAGEEWKLKAFREQDAGTGPEVYVIGASRLLNIPIEQVTKEQRQAYGKVPDLAFQYQGGVGSGHIMGKTYGVYATDGEWARRRDAWRASHPRIKAVWFAIQKAAISAVQHPGEVYACGWPGREAKYKKVGSFLWCLLPSGRAICFPYPKILDGEFGPQLTYMTVPSPDDIKKGDIIYDPKNASNWARVSTYGGALFNRVVQGFCRDFLADGMLTLDEAGAELVLHTHDSLAAEIDDGKAERARGYVETVMCQPQPWAAGFPLTARPEIVKRYAG
jgi:DNA polymerase